MSGTPGTVSFSNVWARPFTAPAAAIFSTNATMSLSSSGLAFSATSEVKRRRAAAS
jgi:hypothetical protein